MTVTADAPRSRAEEDAVLVARAAAGDERAFAVLYDTHRARLYRLAYGIVLDPNEAREAVQEAFLKLHLAAPAWEPRAAIGTWLHRVVLHHCLGLKQRLLRFARPMLAPRTQKTPESEAVLGEAMRIVEEELAKLSLKQRAVATLFLDGELAPAEIAPLVGMTPNATRVTLHRALASLRATLAAAGIDATPTPDELALAEEHD
ncbi:MAG: sigma-70 family RNA polymerase sigma factor [Labilithrix sp.]|nr:sigma-70 family RNA polymerase sigma factor [Labilithrix sp.]MCW5809590.1 sigma-70 family RNA polymerase sigma factor [Labilithrix sp.]